jgi:hypothetical protein
LLIVAGLAADLSQPFHTVASNRFAPVERCIGSRHHRLYDVVVADGGDAEACRFSAHCGETVAGNGFPQLFGCSHGSVKVGVVANDQKLFTAPAPQYIDLAGSIGQQVRHFDQHLKNMKMQLELARSMSFYACLKLNAPAPERRAAMARAKYQLGQSMRFVGQQAVQLHGGIGVTEEYIVSHYLKKLTQLEMTFGDSLHHLGEVSARMQDSAGVFA